MSSKRMAKKTKAAPSSAGQARKSTKGKVASQLVRKPMPRGAAAASSGTRTLPYDPQKGVIDLAGRVRSASPLQLVQVEREGVRGRVLKDLAPQMEIPASRFFRMMGVAKATAERKAARNEMIAGTSGQAAIGMLKLLGMAQSIVENSTAPQAREFDTAKWLGQWIERPQPALGGKRPAELLDTPTGIDMVSRVLGAIESGAYL